LNDEQNPPLASRRTLIQRLSTSFYSKVKTKY